MMISSHITFANHVLTVLYYWPVSLVCYKMIALVTVYLPGWIDTVALALSSGIRTWVSEM